MIKVAPRKVRSTGAELWSGIDSPRRICKEIRGCRTLARRLMRVEDAASQMSPWV